MELAPAKSQARERTGVRRPWLRTLLALLIAALLAGLYAGLALRARAVRQADLRRYYHEPWEIEEQFRALGPLTAAELGAKFNQQIQTRPLGRDRTIGWVRLPSGHMVRVLFDAGGQLYDSRATAGPAPRPSRLFLALEAAHPRILTWTLPLWAVLLGLAVIFRPLRRVAVQTALVVAAIGLAAALVYHGRSVRIVGVESYIILVPFYTTQAGLVAVSAIIVAFTLLGRRRDPNDVRCPRCRYDLRGNQSGVCPECGLRIPPSLRWKLRLLSGKSAETVPVAAETPFTITDEPPDETEVASPP